jgi:precorrin-4 methylase
MPRSTWSKKTAGEIVDIWTKIENSKQKKAALITVGQGKE